MTELTVGAALALATLRLDLDADGVALITIDDPARAMNVTSPELVRDLMAALARVARDPAIVGAVLTSGKSNGFVAGGDIKNYAHAHERGMTEAEAFEISHRWNVDLRRIERCGKPIAAALNGLALGGGLELALCCGHRVLADDPKAVVGCPEVTIGLLPAGGGSQRLPRLIGIEPALEIMLEGTRLSPSEALALGVVDAVVAREQVVQAARRWVLSAPDPRQPWDRPGYRVPGSEIADWHARTLTRVMARTRGRYPAPLALLTAVRDGTPLGIEDGLRVESQCFAALLPGAVARNLMRTGFIHKGLAKRFVSAGALGGSSPLPRVGGIEGDAGRYLERLWQAYVDEASALLEEGVSVERIDAAAHAADLATPPSVAARALGRPLAAPQRALNPSRSLEAIERRLLAAPALEALRCLDDGLFGEGAALDAALADVGSVVGTGFPRWSGGVLSYIDTLGVDVFVAECETLAREFGARYTPTASLRRRCTLGNSPVLST
jgi:3-hydroxyacyl-CoA dehydrogenase / enoyl-CoA hydratase / 3-hydroxybutyryl-CoA epimerase